jgi:hypothetical protein
VRFSTRLFGLHDCLISLTQTSAWWNGPLRNRTRRIKKPQLTHALGRPSPHARTCIRCWMGTLMSALVACAALCVLGPLVFIPLFVWLGRVMGRVGGYGELSRLYAFAGQAPPNTRWRGFMVGPIGNSGGSAGSDSVGLYLHGGLMGDDLFVPWQALRRVATVGCLAFLRETHTGILLVVPRTLLPTTPDREFG